MNTNINVSVKFFNDTKGFGFFRQSEKGAPDMFVHLAVLEASGFTKADMVMDKPAVVDFSSSHKGLIVTKIHSIGDKKTPPTELKSIVDRSGDLVIVKVVEIKTGRHLFEIRKDSVDGEQIGQDLFCLAQARQKIGKDVRPPVSNGHGIKTNVPKPVAKKQEGNNDNKKGGKKKAA